MFRADKCRVVWACLSRPAVPIRQDVPLSLQRLQDSRHFLGLGLGDCEFLDDDRFLVGEFAKDRHAGGLTDRLSRQVIFIIAGLGALGGTAAAPLVGSRGPTRALPVPFCRNSFLVLPATSLRRSVECVPAR